MLVPNLLMWAAAAIAALWKLSQIARAPRDKGLHAVTICTVLVVLALTAQLAGHLPTFAAALPAGFPKLAQNTLLTVFFALLIVLLHGSVSPQLAARRGYREIGLALLTSAVLTATFARTEPDDRTGYEDAAAPDMLAFYLAGNLYLAYACARGAHLAKTTAEHTRSRARLSLHIAAAGLLINLIGTHLPRAISTASRLFLGIDPIPGTATWTTPILAIGITTFFLGIGYPGARTALIKTRLWFEARRTYRRLRPLWSALTDRFPTIALFPKVSPARERRHLRAMRLRTYRRIIEIRDGLVCLSPYLPEPADANHSPAQQAQLIHTALRRSTTDTPPRAPSIIAPPGSTDADADTRQLLAIAAAFARFESTSDTDKGGREQNTAS
ncbi:MAB_1171c family putative transporter [Saccharopolyspora gloriosae]|uniref:MAB_1171c family putative transporter n=1 Tax=Saccharopolyspora gloriosae TaxID=455344 RepID=UPI001FB6EF9B|nr:MAB_1171c family putative transporter [Saccharopolyspora gloriosae]